MVILKRGAGRLSQRLLILTALFTLVACSALTHYELNQRFGSPEPKARITADSQQTQLFREQVEPILNSRCVVCHACYDAPCQLKLSSPEGIDRGLTQAKVYSAKRLIAADPTRLFIDETTTEGWRSVGFDPVLNERSDTPDANLAGSLLYQLLALKQQHPLPDDTTLASDTFDFALHRNESCPTRESFDTYARANPLAGMPYGMPGLNAGEFASIEQWLATGGRLPAPEPLPAALASSVAEWEALLNQPDNKTQLVARYLYEHLFLANLYFDEVEPEPAARTYFKLVRSLTPPGQAIEIIASRRPTDDPGSSHIYYRLQAQSSTVVAKTHLPYPLNHQRRQWLQRLFFDEPFEVAGLPGYEREHANPFATFAAIPARSRYEFLLADSHYYIAGFIKGPVCRGPVAVDVINDRFWVVFVNPKATALPMLDGFLESQAANLRLPGEQGSNGNILAYWLTYSELHRNYLVAKGGALQSLFAEQPIDLDLIWDGDSNNANAALTIFRNYDDAAVVRGLVGTPPKTAWVIDYPLLERIHYLLTVDFDVYGNLAHQLNTRMYMDFLRIEGELNFLTLLPAAERAKLLDYWYRDAAERVVKQLQSYHIEKLGETAVAYQTETPQLELYQQLRQHLQPVLSDFYSLANAQVPEPQAQLLSQLEAIRGPAASQLSETTLLLVEGPNNKKWLYTLLANHAHLNITSLFAEQSNRIPAEDSITVAKGVIGDYPNTFLRVTEAALPELVADITVIENAEDYAHLLDHYGVRRTNPDFWAFSDELHQLYRAGQPASAGWLDYNRFENR
ncbi:fatty acid cis/trans isomerase [Halioxenophilus sp. WMMB6]|uniref:fatty acid cis/trans isomerase n=1 Tax=Halioxenophilus sp. WMMB6 TaxID=3073815 RepID=UPI00295ED843|nr:fatty acid cis/trans isomerase [Halioxenophilus sp. WMMB6]